VRQAVYQYAERKDRQYPVTLDGKLGAKPQAGPRVTGYRTMNRNSTLRRNNAPASPAPLRAESASTNPP
jgi:hypothetical protein